MSLFKHSICTLSASTIFFLVCLTSNKASSYSPENPILRELTHFVVTDPLTVVSPASNMVNTAPELIFNITKNSTSTQSVVIRNDQSAAITISEITLAGANAATFTISDSPAPFTLMPGATATVEITFSPNGTVGVLSAQLQFTTNTDSNLSVGLYGLSTKGLEGNNEPSLNAIVQTLGYDINVGDTQLILPTTPAPIGDEVLVELFQKASAGPVTIQPVARYSPSGPLTYGYYLPNGDNVATEEVAIIAGDQGQALNPTLAEGNQTFDPGNQAFGLYADVTSYAAQKTFTEDDRNTGPLSHAVRTYPVKNRAGTSIPNAYLVCMEPASNGDYQDYVFLLTNIKPAGT